MRGIGIGRKLFHAFDFQNPYRRARLFPDQGEIQMRADRRAFVTVPNLQLRQHMQAQGRKALTHAIFKPVSPLQGEQAFQ